MAVDPVTIAKAATTVGKVASSENGRHVILMSILTPLILILLILSSPFAIFFGLFDDGVDSVPIQTVIQELQNKFRTKIEEEQNDTKMDTITTIVVGSEDNTLIDNTVDVLSFFSALHTTLNGEQVSYLDDKAIRELKEIFWEMNEITTDVETKTRTKTSEDEHGITHTETINTYHKTIWVNSLTAEEMTRKYNFTDEQKTVLKELKTSSNSLMPIGSNMYLSLHEIEEIKSNLPQDLDIKRKQTVEKALSIAGKVHYFWGGKSSAIGWDNRWGTPTKVTSEGSTSTGTVRPFGLDCSGYVTWVFINIGLDVSTIEKTIGHGTTNQWELSTTIIENQVKVGDLAFLAIPNTRKDNHVGIVVGFNEDGQVLVAHCNASANNVSIDRAKNVGLRCFGRPAILIE